MRAPRRPAFPALAGAAFLLLSTGHGPTVDATSRAAAAWTPYADARTGFTASVPADWTILPAPATGGIAPATTFLVTGPVPSDTGRAIVAAPPAVKVEIGLEPYARPPEVPLAEWLAPDPDLPAFDFTDTPLRIGGADGLKRSVAGETGYVVFVPSGSRVFYVARWVTGEPGARRVAQADAIVASFAPPAAAREVLTLAMRPRLFAPASGVARGTEPSRRSSPAELRRRTVPDARASMAPSGFRLPFAGREMITYGPGCPGATHSDNEAIDFSLRYGPVLATASGTIVYAAYAGDNSYGNLVKVEHEDGNISYYGHLQDFAATSGEMVSGRYIATSGSTGNSTGPHLHYEVRAPGGDPGSPVPVRDLPGLVWYSGSAEAPCTEETYDGHGDGPAEQADPPSGCLAESDHPYTNQLDRTWWVHNTDADASGVRVHFSRVAVEQGFDELVVYDGAGAQVQRITGAHEAGLTTEIVPGRTARIRLRTSARDTDWGFCADQLESACTDKAELVWRSEPMTVDPRAVVRVFLEARNTGTCTWRTADRYVLARVFGDETISSGSVGLPGVVAPGESAHFDLELTMPATEGDYRPHWMLRHSQQHFGPDMYVDLTVRKSSGDLPTPSPDQPPIRDIGLRPTRDGYAFANYGGEYPFPPAASDFDRANMASILGAQAACVHGAGPTCVARPQAMLWNQLVNLDMNRGHADGMAASVLRYFRDLDDPSELQPGAGSPHELASASARGTISAYQALQSLDPVAARKESSRKKTPRDIMTELLAAMTEPAVDPVTIVIRRPGRGGHVLVPYAVYEQGPGAYSVMVYDPNHPDDEKRAILVETARNSWRYDLGGNLGEWTGGIESQTLALVPLSKYGETPACEWCDGAGRQTTHFRGGGTLFVTDDQGRRIGIVGSRRISELPGAWFVDSDGGLGVESRPAYAVPDPGTYTLHLTGEGISRPTVASMSHLGPRFGVAAEGRLVPESDDSMTVGNAGTTFNYRVKATKEVTLTMAADVAVGGARLRLGSLNIDAGQAVAVAVEPERSRFFVRNGQTTAQYGLDLLRADESGEHWLKHGSIPLGAGAVHIIDVSKWDGYGPVDIEIDDNGDGTVDRTLPVENALIQIALPRADR